MVRLNRKPLPGRRARLADVRSRWFSLEANWRFSVLLVAEGILVFLALPLLSKHGAPHVVARLLVLVLTAGMVVLISNSWSVRVGVIGSVVLAAFCHALPGYFPILLTTVGYGDILPRTPTARSLADLEAVIGQLFPATLPARLIGMQIGRV